MLRNTNRIVSTFRSTVTVDSLRRINNVTGTEFPVSGDAPLRDKSWERCSYCNYDAHTCRGCGEPMQHGELRKCKDC